MCAAIENTNKPAVDIDLRCESCGYQLYSLGYGAVCPECSVPVFESLSNSRLMYADIRWLGLITRGLTLATVSLLITLSAITLSFFAEIIASVFDSDLIRKSLETPGLILAFEVAVHLATIADFWFFAARPPSIRSSAVRNDAVSRRVVRVACVAALISLLPAIGVKYAEAAPISKTLGLAPTGTGTWVMIQVASDLLLILSSLWYARQIIHRSTYARLCSLIIAVFWAMIIAAIFVIAQSLIAPETLGRNLEPFHVLISFFAAVVVIIAYAGTLIQVTLAIRFEHRNNLLFREGRNRR